MKRFLFLTAWPIVYLLYFFYSRICKNEKIIILDSMETVDCIINQKLSISRFGDGELKIIRGKGIGFQKYTPKLSRRLKEVLQSDVDNHMVCILHVISGDFRIYKLFPTIFWKYNMLCNKRVWIKYLSKSCIYGDSLFTRFYIDTKERAYSERMINRIKAIWENKDILVVEGNQSRLGVGNDLFQVAKSIHRVLCPAKNAFDYYDEILEKTIKHATDRLILIALGPTATILSYDLSTMGHQAIDIGHIDIEYEWFMMKAHTKIPIEGKYVNECSFEGGEISDILYKSQIVEIVN